MNGFETWLCGSPFWRYVTRRQLLPWMLEGSELGEHVLELGAGLGAATGELGQRATRVTSLEYDHSFAAKLGTRVNGSNAAGVLREAAALAFVEGAIFSGIPGLLRHHLRL